MRVTLDTNVLVAALIARGVCNELLEHCIRHHQHITSDFILVEPGDVLLARFDMYPDDVQAAIRLVRQPSVVVEPEPLDRPACRDRDDDEVLATAAAGESRCIVSGDNDLLVLEEHDGIDIIEPSSFWRYEALR